jgi:hypothetical protein
MSKSLLLQELRGDLEFVERQISDRDDPYDTVRLMWEQRKAALETEITKVSDQSDSFAQVALLFTGKPVAGSQEIRLDFVAKVLGEYQFIVATLAASRAGNELHARGPLPSAYSSRLFLRDMVRGSVGFLIEEARPEQYALVPSILKEAVEETTTIINSLSEEAPGGFERSIRELSPRTVDGIKRMTKVLHDFGAETRIVAQSHELILTHARTNLLFSRLFEVEFLERNEQREGMLLGLFPERRQYEFKPAGDGPIIYGPVSENLDAHYLADPEFARSILLRPVLATFTVNITARGGIPLTEERVLENVETKELPPRLVGA